MQQDVTILDVESQLRLLEPFVRFGGQAEMVTVVRAVIGGTEMNVELKGFVPRDEAARQVIEAHRTSTKAAGEREAA